MNWQTAKQIATQNTGRTPRWCDVRDQDDEIAPAPTAEAMDDCIALDANGNVIAVESWNNERPNGHNVEAICYF